jgi:hypothetical protein
MHLVHRPVGATDGPQRLAELRNALDAEQVAPGAPFQVSAVALVDLDGPGAARADDPETARQAALNPALDRARSRRAVLVALAQLGEATSRQVADHLGVDRSQVSPRLNELGPGAPSVRYDPPLVRKTGRVRPGLGSGVLNETWQLTEYGAAWLAAREVTHAA